MAGSEINTNGAELQHKWRAHHDEYLLKRRAAYLDIVTECVGMLWQDDDVYGNCPIYTEFCPIGPPLPLGYDAHRLEKKALSEHPHWLVRYVIFHMAFNMYINISYNFLWRGDALCWAVNNQEVTKMYSGVLSKFSSDLKNTENKSEAVMVFHRISRCIVMSQTRVEKLKDWIFVKSLLLWSNLISVGAASCP